MLDPSWPLVQALDEVDAWLHPKHRDGEGWPTKPSHAKEARELAVKKSTKQPANSPPSPQYSKKSWKSPSLQSEESNPSLPHDDGRPPQQLLNWEYKSERYITVRADHGLLGWWYGKRACLLRFHVHISSAEKVDKLRIRLYFVPEHGAPDKRGPVSVFFLGPEALYGEDSREHKHTTIGGGASIKGGMPGIATGGIGAHGTRQSRRDVTHQQTLHGWSDCEENISRITWEVRENERTKKGVPSDLFLAAVVQYKGDKGVKVSAEAKAPSRPLQRKPEPRTYTVKPDLGDANFSSWGERDWRVTGMTCELGSR